MEGLFQRWCIKIIHDHILPDHKIWRFKSQVSAAAAALFNSNAQCGAAFCFLDVKDLKLMDSIIYFTHQVEQFIIQSEV
jgi:hypothetical protein